VAGSVAPLDDCYRPDLSPTADVAEAEHRELAAVLADAGCDLLLCETFPHAGEAMIAVEACVATGLPVWVSLTPGPDGGLLSPGDIADAARDALRRGAAAVMVNCVAAPRAVEYVRALASAAGGAPFGAYANAGRPDDRIGWQSPGPSPGAAARYADHAAEWVAAGATLVGSCCGTGPRHIAELARRFGDSGGDASRRNEEHGEK
jgi:S-methylmethionine-dependent homocysteine/selenocysteine methylase